MRLAFFTPLNPVRSGISDYSEELLPYLGQLAEVEIVTGAYQPATQEITRRFRILQPPEFLEQSSSYDAVIYQIGNNYQAHAYMLPCLAAVPGITVLHDYSLTYLILPLTAQRGDIASLTHILRHRYGDRAASMSWKILLGLVDPYEVSLALPVIEMSRAVIVHNHHAYGKLKSEFPAKRFALIPHATPIRELRHDAGRLRADYGFLEQEFLVASVSSIAYNKRMHVVLTAIAGLTREFPNIKFVMVGQGNLGSEAAALIRRFGIQNNVLQTGWVTSQQYLDYIDMADVVIDLRSPTAGETSGSSLRALQAAKPLVVSAEGFFLELPDDACIRLPVQGNHVANLKSAIASLITDPDRRKRMGMAGRTFALANLRLEQAAASYYELARTVAGAAGEPVRRWDFPDERKAGIRKHIISRAYQAGRLGYYYKRYGLAGTLQRIRSEMKSGQ